ncbi:MAG: hypothetical protein HQM10_24470 [Candidatus Riflebacteria bacterium]|nr:hypothetical protein [Candidatus Riflebacteria bacterium]
MGQQEFIFLAGLVLFAIAIIATIVGIPLRLAYGSSISRTQIYCLSIVSAIGSVIFAGPLLSLLSVFNTLAVHLVLKISRNFPTLYFIIRENYSWYMWIPLIIELGIIFSVSLVTIEKNFLKLTVSWKQRFLLFPLIVLSLAVPVFLQQLSQPDAYHNLKGPTKATMSNIKSTLCVYRNDLGNFPHTGFDHEDSEAYVKILNLLTATTSQNIMLTARVDGLESWKELGLSSEDYQRRWKGPYFENQDEPKDYFTDSWEQPIRLAVFDNSNISGKYPGKILYLWSGGGDKAFGKFPERWIRAEKENNNSTSSQTELIEIDIEGEDDLFLAVGKI